MPRAVPLPVRQEIVARYQAGQSLTAIASELGLVYRTVRGIWQYFRERGAAGLAPNYEACRRTGPKFPAEVHAAALALKAAHPTWGAPLIRLELAAAFPEPLPSVRTLQLWFRRADLHPRRARHPTAPRDRGQAPHAVWQLDAKEHVKLGDGQEVSVFSVVDEASGAVLSSATFSPRQRHPGAAAAGASLAGSRLCGLGPAGAAAGG